jgi:hypothetical protein
MTKTMCSILSAASLLVTLGACAAPLDVSAEQAAQNAKIPGWTGRTFVVGSNSTIAGDAVATYDQQKWQLGRGR